MVADMLPPESVEVGAVLWVPPPVSPEVDPVPALDEALAKVAPAESSGRPSSPQAVTARDSAR
jgi:hypothetical protein